MGQSASILNGGYLALSESVMRLMTKERDKRGGSGLVFVWGFMPNFPGFAMRLKWIALTFLLGFIVILDPTLTPGQDGKREKGKGGGGGFGNGGFGKGGGGFPGGGGFTPNAGGMPPGGGGGFNFKGGPGGGGGGGPGGGGGAAGNAMRAMASPDGAWALLQQQSGSTGDTIDLSQVTSMSRLVEKNDRYDRSEPTSRNWHTHKK